MCEKFIYNPIYFVFIPSFYCARHQFPQVCGQSFITTNTSSIFLVQIQEFTSSSLSIQV